ncbi:MAG: gliding motility-associated C-terminal domain-containing protein, partial [Bacteroidetes bacterium]|nr:gliding motility-associated C-terminal domain-containing protein [Bacteroidota bacterium]
FCNSLFPDSTIPPGNRKRVIVQPYYEVSLLAPDTVCPKVPFEIEDQSDKMYTTFTTYFGDSTNATYQSKKYTHSYNQSGSYMIKHYPDYIPVFPYKHCVKYLQKPIYVIDIHADFDTTLLGLVNGSSYQFTNKSINAVRYLWDFGQPQSGGANSSKDKDPTHHFGGDSGWYDICLYAFSQEGCVDTACKSIYNPITRKLVIPNVYTNDGDGINDAFDIEIIGEDYYKLYIYNQWGELLFTGNSDGQSDDGVNWNGRNFNTGAECPTGTYYYLFEYHFIGDEKNGTSKGTVTLLRENK